MQRFLSGAIGTIFLVTFSLPLSGCFYNGKLHNDFYKNSQSNRTKVPASVAVVFDKNSFSKIKTKGAGGFSFEIDLYEGLKKAVENAMADVFQRVILSETISENNKVDLVVVPTFKAVVAYSDYSSMSQIYDAEMTISIESFKDRLELATYKKSGRIPYEHPPVIMFTGFLLGLSLFTLSPVIMPLNAQISGTRRVELFESFISEKIDETMKDVRRDAEKLVLAARDESHAEEIVQKDSKQSLEAMPSKYDPYLKSVVKISNSSGLGTGFFISKNGYIITNNHVVGSEGMVTVTLYDRRSLIGRVISTDERRDLALVHVNGDDFSWVVLGQPADASIGTEVIAIGMPRDLPWSVSKGIVSGIRKYRGTTLVQTDTAINPGNSGGPLISLQTGKIIGVNTFKFRQEITDEGMNFSVASTEIYEAFPQIRELR